MIDKLVVKLLVLKMWLSDDHGQDLIEYAMLGGLIAVILIAASTLLTITGALTGMVAGIGRCIDFDGTTPCAPF